MPSVYTNDLRLEEIATGEQPGTWGTTTNTNLELIAEAFGYGTEEIDASSNPTQHSTTLVDGTSSPGRSLFLTYTSSASLSSSCTITIGPNNISKLWFVQNSTTGGQNIIVKQGSGATITVPNGQVKAIFSDGAGASAAMTDAFTGLSVPSLFVAGSAPAGIGDVLALSIALG